MKFIVLLFCVVTVQSYSSKYCEICLNHTLCKYSVGGPTYACRNFDKGTLGDEDIEKILNRINARRNLVAIGRLKKFPQAANMRKVQWSAELASFAQRWADQCDPSVRPNKEDECRDLVGMHVGQSIAAVVGPAPGLNIRSFVDMWFMMKLHYTGNVVYYNQSRDQKTNYFTQLIWADTEYVGCGKIDFFNPEINTVVVRLVCNFAPKGNNHGKPVYALGFPATQCPKFMTPDLEFSGLCKQDHKTATGTVTGPSASSLLRILDSSNSSAKQDLDPNNLKQIISNSSETKNQRNQKTRHAYINSNGAIKRDSFHMQSPHLNPLNDIDNFKGHPFTPERGHSRMYHGHLTKIESIPNFQTTQSFSEQDYRRYDLTTTANPLPIQHNHDHSLNGRRISNNQNDYVPDGRRIINNQNDFVLDSRRIISDQNDYVPDGRRNFGACTRKPKCNDCFPKPCGTNQCTRGQSCNSCLNPQPCNSCLQPPFPVAPQNHDMCPCKPNCAPIPRPMPLPMPMPMPMPMPVPMPMPIPPPPPPPPPPPLCPVCPSHNCALSEPTSFCAKRRAQGGSQDTNKSTQYNYYDLFPNIGLRSGDENPQKHIDNSEIEDSLQHKAKDSEINNQVKEIAGSLHMNLQRPQDSHHIFYSSGRKKRDFEDQMTFKPFWQMDEYNYKRPTELRSLRYTTLSDKRNKKSRWTSLMKLPTESITIKLADELIHNGPHRDHITEKYLSFEELMHLRKLSTLEAFDYEVRRFGEDALRAVTTKKAAATTKKAAATTKKVAATTKKVAATTKPAATTKKVAATTKSSAATTKNAAVTTKQAAGGTTPQVLKAPATTAKLPVPSITANTPFIRLKQCTRKITCTWTALMLMIGSDGKLVTGITNGAGQIINNIEVGSRTPPGYVDGCTRTSTCTRDFMDRNKMPAQTTKDESSNDSNDSYNDSTKPDDEEYCEKRSLNIQRRNLDNTDQNFSIEFKERHAEITSSSPHISVATNRRIDDTEMLQYKHGECNCYEDNSRIKRDEISKYKQQQQKNCNNMMEISTEYHTDDIYSMFNKMSIDSKSDIISHRCACNGAKSTLNTLDWRFLLRYSFIWTYYNVCVRFILLS